MNLLVACLCQERFYLLVAYIPPIRMYHLAAKLHNSAAAGNVCGPRRPPYACNGTVR